MARGGLTGRQAGCDLLSAQLLLSIELHTLVYLSPVGASISLSDQPSWNLSKKCVIAYYAIESIATSKILIELTFVSCFSA